VARPLALTAALAATLLAASGAGGAGAETPRRGGTVVVAYFKTEPPCLNYFVDKCRGGTTDWGDLVANVIDSALRAGPHGWLSDLASSVAMTTKPFTVTYRIRTGVRWSDGSQITASDFVSGYRVLRNNREVGWDPLGMVRNVRALDPSTVRIVFRQRWGRWREDARLVALPHRVLAGTSFKEDWKNGIDDPRTGRPIGSGPFLVQRWERGRELVLARNRRYWGSHLPYLDKLVFRFVSDPAEALRSGAVDVVDQSAAAEFVTAPPAGIKVLSIPGSGWEHFDINLRAGGHPALRNKLVRRALAYGIDREALVHKLFGDIAPNVEPLDSAVFLTNDPYYQPNWSLYRYRPTWARRLLEEAGCRRGSDGVFTCGGERLSLRFLTTAGNARREQTLEIVQAQLRQIGVEVLPKYAPGNALFAPEDGILAKGDFDVALFSWNRMSPEQVDSTYRCENPFNFGGYCTRLVDDDLDQLDVIVEPKRRVDVGGRVDRRLAADVPTIPLFQSPIYVAFRESIHGIVPNAFNALTWNAENWWRER